LSAFKSTSASEPENRLAAYFKPPLTIESVYLLAAPLALVLAALLAPIRPFDYFWALVQGRAAVQLGHIPAQNLFLHTLPADAPFFDQPWLAQIILFVMVRLGGHSANLLLLAGLLFLAMAITIDTALRTGGRPRTVAAVALAVTPLLALGAGVRTQMFAYPCFAVVLRGLVLRLPNRTLPGLWPSLLAAALWSNLHGSFVLAPAMFAIGAAIALLAPSSVEYPRATRIKHGLLELAAIGVATLVNPRGPHVYRYATGLAGQMYAKTGGAVQEWVALSPGSLAGVLFYLLASLGVVCAILAWRRLSPAALAIHVLLAVLAVGNQRFVAWWGLSAIVAFACLFGATQNAERRPGPAWPNLGILAGMALALLLTLPGMPLFERVAPRAHVGYPEARALGTESPLHLAERLAKGYPGKLFHTQAIGGLLEWTLATTAPRPVAFVDQRFEITPPELWHDYFAICDARPNWRSLLERYGIGTILVDQTNAARLIDALANDPAWKLVGRELAYHLYQTAPQPTR
jgi:hypothetical protein